jgi:hypothetical protein
MYASTCTKGNGKQNKAFPYNVKTAHVYNSVSRSLMKAFKQVTSKIVKSTERPLNTTDSIPSDDGVKKHKTVRTQSRENRFSVWPLESKPNSHRPTVKTDARIIQGNWSLAQTILTKK